MDKLITDAAQAAAVAHRELMMVLPSILDRLRKIPDPGERAVVANNACKVAKDNLAHYRRLRNEAIREWVAAKAAKPAHVAARLGLARSSVSNILNGKDCGDV